MSRTQVLIVFGRLPPLQALRAFEAAARCGSFKDAAAELFVTPTAISHSVRGLEEQLGAALFVRHTRRIELTELGRALAPALTRGFLEMRSALEDVVAAESVVTVSTTPAFAALRLVPELPNFYAMEPEIRVQVDTSTVLVDLRRDRRTDLAIRYGMGLWEGLESRPLMNERFAALAAPGRFDASEIEADATLLETRWQQPILGDVVWSVWFAEAGLMPPAENRIVAFDEELYVLQAAIAGHGIALASTVLAADLLARDLLEVVAPERDLAGFAYSIVCFPEQSGRRKVRRFVEWLGDTFSEGMRTGG